MTDPQDDDTQRGAGCLAGLLFALPLTAIEVWRHRHELAAEALAALLQRRRP